MLIVTPYRNYYAVYAADAAYLRRHFCRAARRLLSLIFCV